MNHKLVAILFLTLTLVSASPPQSNLDQDPKHVKPSPNCPSTRPAANPVSSSRLSVFADIGPDSQDGDLSVEEHSDSEFDK